MATIRKLSKADDRAGFTCGDDDLDRFFRQHAGVATAATGQGLGKALLKHALTLGHMQADMLGCVGVVVDAKPNAVTFYERYGFTAITSAPPDERPRLFLPISAVPRAS